MSPGRIENKQGQEINSICEGRFHVDEFRGGIVMVVESFHELGGLDLILQSGRLHLSPGDTIGLKSGLVVIPEHETPIEFQTRDKISKPHKRRVLAKIRTFFPETEKDG